MNCAFGLSRLPFTWRARCAIFIAEELEFILSNTAALRRTLGEKNQLSVPCGDIMSR